MSAIGTWKIVNRNDPGSSDQYGTDDTELIMRLLAGVTAGQQPPIVQIKSAQGWEFYPGICPVWIRDVDGSHKLQLLTENMTADANLTIPAFVGNAKLLIDAAANQFTGIQKFDSVVKLKPQTTPATDAAYGELFVDSADNKLKYKNPAGTVIDLTAAAAAAAPTAAKYVTLGTDATLSQERVLTAGDGVTWTDGGAGSTVKPSLDYTSFAKSHVGFYDDFFGDSAFGGSYFQISLGGGTVSNLGVSETGIFGAWQLSTGPTATGRASIGSGNNNSWSLGQGVTTIEMKLKNSTLSNATDQYRMWAGLADATSGSHTDAIDFVYEQALSTFWRIRAMSNTVATTTNTATTHGTGWEVLKIVIDAAASQASYFVNGVEVSGSPISTNIPSGTGRELTLQLRLEKNAGTTPRTANIDYAALDIKLTTPR